MTGSFITLALLTLVIMALIAVVTGVLIAAAGKGTDPSHGARRRIQIVYSIAALVGLTFALVAFLLFPTVYVNETRIPGLLAALAPTLAGILFVSIAMIGEGFWPKPKGEKRGAFLGRRPTIAKAVTLAERAAVTWGVLLVVFLVIFGLIANPTGEAAGRSLAHPVWHPNIAGASGPFPGWPYGVPMLLFVVVLVTLTFGVLHVIARRPAVYGTTPEQDLALREISATNVITGVQLSLGASLTGVLFTAGVAARRGGAICEDGYCAELVGHWWAGPVLLLAAAVLISTIGVLARRHK